MRAMIEHAKDLLYASADGWRMEREQGMSPHGNRIHGRWVLRNPQGLWVDFDQYRTDLAERNGLNLVFIEQQRPSRLTKAVK